MGTMPKRKYTAEFRTQAVRIVRKSRFPQAEAAWQLGISAQTLATWMKQARKGNAALFSVGSVTQEQQQIALLSRELAESRAKVDILRRAMMYFAKVSR